MNVLHPCHCDTLRYALFCRFCAQGDVLDVSYSLRLITVACSLYSYTAIAIIFQSINQLISQSVSRLISFRQHDPHKNTTDRQADKTKTDEKYTVYEKLSIDNIQDCLSEQTKVDHPQIYVFSYARVTLNLTP